MDALLEHLEEVIEQTRTTVSGALVSGALGDGQIIVAADGQIHRATDSTSTASVRRCSSAARLGRRT